MTSITSGESMTGDQRVPMLIHALQEIIADAEDCAAFQEAKGCIVEASQTHSRIRKAREAIAQAAGEA